MAALDHLRLDMGDLPDMALRFAPGHAAIEGEAGPGQAEGIVLAKADAGAVGEAEPARLDLSGRGAKRLKLRPVGRAVLVRAGEMAHQGLDLQPIEQAARQLLRPDPEPVDAGVDHDVARPPGLLPAHRLLAAVQHRPHRQLHRRRHVLSHRPMQHAQLQVAGPGREQLRFRPSGDEEGAAARRLQALHRLARAEAVSIGLHGRAAIGAAAPVRQPVPVGDQGVAVDAEAKGIVNHRPRLARRGPHPQSRFLPAVSGSQNKVTIKAIATTPIVYQRPENGSPVRATIYWLMKGRNPPK